ncbi:MAG: sensor N-terminal transmembrane domain-containing protein [Spirochaetales bacterium]|nr:sensor N-terminal transmembrane domain-containing protein [Spirochaetales bacterium]
MRSGRARRPFAFLSRISVRLLAFNLLVVFLPVAALLYLDTYERQLLQALEHALVQQGRILAAAVAARPTLDEIEARRILVQLEQRHEARLRVVDAQGRLLADSSRLGPVREPAPSGSSRSADPSGAPDPSRAPEPSGAPDPPDAAGGSAADSLLYRLASAPVRLWRRLFRPPEPPLDSAEYYVGATVLQGPEIRDALAGRYGAMTRISTGGQRSVTLYSAIPIRIEGAVVGAVLVSQSTYRILRDLYELRLQIFTILLAALAAAAALSLVASTTIVGPIARLQRQAREILDHRGRLRGHFRPPRRRDEIGDLSRALHELTLTMEAHLRFMESFASDLSHELKNPLATIRSATEILSESSDPRERRRFLELIQQEVARSEALASSVREISRIDTQLEQEDRQLLDLREMAERVVESLRLRSPGAPAAFSVEPPSGFRSPTPAAGGDRPTVRMAPARAAQILENLLDNAASFSPGEVRVLVGREDGYVRVSVLDRGPGIPPGNLSRVFDRFFSFRPEARGSEARRGSRQDAHLGLGLAIVKAIVEGYGGSVRAGNREGGGACLEVLLPAAES